VIGHAELLAPRRLTAGAGVVVAAFRGHDAHVALGQFGHAGVAVTLAETGFGLALAAMGAVDRPQVFQATVLPIMGLTGTSTSPRRNAYCTSARPGAPTFY
jgi:acyl-coenzyme A thioesterase PaaI-like protein